MDGVTGKRIKKKEEVFGKRQDEGYSDRCSGRSERTWGYGDIVSKTERKGERERGEGEGRRDGGGRGK